MALKFKVNKEEYDALSEGQQEMYAEAGDGYQLQVEGLDDGAQLKEALRKEREDRAEAKRRLQEMETEAEQRERERMEKQQEWEQLSKSERERADKLKGELDELRRGMAEKTRNESASAVTSALTRDTARERLLRREALNFISHTPEGVRINGPDGEAWDSEQLSKYLKEQYPFLVDGVQSSGGGAIGGKGSGAVSKKWSEMTGMERVELRKNDPEEHARLKRESSQ